MRLAARLGRAAERRWQRLALGALSGAVLALTLPPFDVVPAIVAWSGLLWLLGAVEGLPRAGLERALLGAAFGFGYHLAGLWWIGAALLVDADAFGAFLPVAVVGVPLILAPFSAAAAALVGLAPRGIGWRALALAVAVAALEMVRGVAFTGFPWNVAGEGLTGWWPFAQGAALVGLSGLAVPAVLIGALPALLLARAFRAAGAVVALALAMAAFGLWRLDTAVAAGEARPLVRVVQPAVPQTLKWDAAEGARTWRRLLDLTAAHGPDGTPAIVVWPETVLPFVYQTPSLEQFDLVDTLPAGTTLFTGAVSEAEGRYANSVLAIDETGAIVARYDKVKLVPFGEFLPFAPLLSRLGLRGLVANAGNFVAGAEAGVLERPGLPAAQPLICYEVIFPHFLPGRPVGWLLNVTNDAWFGYTPGPFQHFRLARIRAVERGLPLVRAANNGISAVIDAEGQEVARLAHDARGSVDARLPEPRFAAYTIWGDWPLAMVCAMAVLLGVAHCRGIGRARSTAR